MRGNFFTSTFSNGILAFRFWIFVAWLEAQLPLHSLRCSSLPLFGLISLCRVLAILCSNLAGKGHSLVLSPGPKIRSAFRFFSLCKLVVSLFVSVSSASTLVSSFIAKKNTLMVWNVWLYCQSDFRHKVHLNLVPPIFSLPTTLPTLLTGIRLNPRALEWTFWLSSRS